MELFDLGGWWRARKLHRMQPSRIADAPEGVAIRVEGTIVAGETIEAALSGRSCVAYRVDIGGLSDHRPPSSDRYPHGAVAFAIDDGTGRALVDPSGAGWTLPLDHDEKQRTLADPTPRQRALLERFEHQQAFYEPHRFREGALVVGARVAICGHAVREPDPDGVGRGGYRVAPMRLRLAAGPDRPLWIVAL